MFCKIKTKRPRSAEVAFEEANRSIDPVDGKNSGSVDDAFLKRGKGDTRINRLRLCTLERFMREYYSVPGSLSYGKSEIGTKDRK